MKKLITTIVLSIALLTGCGKTFMYTSDGVLIEGVDKEAAHMLYEKELKETAIKERWRAISSLDKENYVAGMAVAFELGRGYNPQMVPYKTWDERALPWAKMMFGWGGGSPLKTLFGETEQSGNNFKVDGDHNNFEFYRVDSRRDTVFNANDSESTTRSTDIDTNTSINKSDNDQYNVGE